MDQPTTCLTIGGSDSGGAAGIQADLRTWALLGVYGMSAVTVLTAQNSAEIRGARFTEPAFLAQQIDAVTEDYGVDGIKTGFLGRVDLIEAIAGRLNAPAVVIDPVLVNHRGEAMFEPAVAAAYRKLLLPRARVVTPNRREAELLTERPVDSLTAAARAAERLHALSGGAVLIKSVVNDGARLDVLFDGDTVAYLPVAVRATANTHGAGDTLSAALTAWLARGEPVDAAVDRARDWTARAIANGAAWSLGRGHGPVWPTVRGA